MPAKIIDGNAIAKKVRADIRARAQILTQIGRAHV